MALLVLPKGRLCAVGVKPNVPLVRLAKIVLKKCGSAKKIKHEALGCRVGKKSAVKFICRLVALIIVSQLMVVVSVFTLAYDVYVYDGLGFLSASLCHVADRN